jgi:hypothetical protein
LTAAEVGEYRVAIKGNGGAKNVLKLDCVYYKCVDVNFIPINLFLKHEQSLQDPWNNNKRSNICFIRVPEGYKKKCVTEKVSDHFLAYS